MAWTASLSVTIGDATKASDYTKLAANAEYLQQLADAEHNFDVSTGTGYHTDITADSITLAGDARLEANSLYFDASDVMAMNVSGTNTIRMQASAVNKFTFKGNSGGTSILDLIADGQDTFVRFSDTTAQRFSMGYDDSADIFNLAADTNLSRTNNLEMNSSGQLLSNMTSVDATTPGYTVQAANSSAKLLGLEIHNDGTAAINSGMRIGFNAETTTNGETPMAYWDVVAADIGASTYAAHAEFMLAGDGAAPVAKLKVRNGHDTSSPILEVRQPDQSPIGFVVANDTFSTSNDRDGYQIWVTDAGTTNIRCYANSTGTHYPLQVNAASHDWRIDANSRMNLTDQTLKLHPYDNGAGGGRNFFAQRNSNGSTPAAAYIRLEQSNGTSYYLWVSSGKLRIDSSEPISTNDTGGSVVGTQT